MIPQAQLYILEIFVSCFIGSILKSLCLFHLGPCLLTWINWHPIITLRPRQNGRHFADDMFKCIFLNKNLWIPIEISLKFVPKGSINNNPVLFQIMAWRRPGDKPLSEPMMVNLLTHICVTRPQWVIWIRYEMSNKVWDETIYPFWNFWKSCTVEVWEWISNCIPHFMMDVIIHLCWV